MRGTYTRVLLTLTLFAVLTVGTAFSQISGEPSEGQFRVGVTAGIATFALGDLRDFTSQVISLYREAGAPVELERNYPPNLIAGGEFLFVGLKPWVFGLSGSYTWTSAYALYGDYAGTLDLHSKVQALSGYIVLQYSFPADWALTPFVDLRGGISSVSLSFNETVHVTTYTDIQVTSEASGDKIGVAGEATAGLRYPFGSLALTGRVGYRYSNISEMEVQFSSSGESLGSGKLGFDINTSGFLGVLTLEIAL